MPYHDWDDEWFEKNGDDLYKAQSFVHDYVYKWTRCRLISKEKYGTIRYEWMFAPGTSIRLGFQIILPLFTKETRWGPMPIALFTWNTCWLVRKWNWWGWKTTWKAVQLAVKKWPHIEHELIEDIASQERLVGKEVSEKYWKKM